MTEEEEEVVRALAIREGFKVGQLAPSGRLTFTKTGRKEWLIFTFRYLESRDALQPIMDSLAPEEWDRFIYILLGNAEGARWLSFEQMIYTIKLPPRDIAFAIAKAIKSHFGTGVSKS